MGNYIKFGSVIFFRNQFANENCTKRTSALTLGVHIYRWKSEMYQLVKIHNFRWFSVKVVSTTRKTEIRSVLVRFPSHKKVTLCKKCQQVLYSSASTYQFQFALHCLFINDCRSYAN